MQLQQKERGLICIALRSCADKWADWAITIANQDVANVFAQQAEQARELANRVEETD